MNTPSRVDSTIELIWRIGLRIVLWVGSIYVIYRVRSIIMFIILAAVLTYMVLPIVDLMCAYRIHFISRRVQRLIATLLIFVGLAALTIAMFIQFAKPFKIELDELAKNSDIYVRQLHGIAVQAQRRYQDLPADTQSFLQQGIHTALGSATKWIGDVGNATIGFFKHFVEIILIPVLAFYFTLDSKSLKRDFMAVIPRSRLREALGL